MRWRLTLLVAATTSAVVLAFLIPLTLLLRSLAEERTLATVTADATNLAQIAANYGATGAAAELENTENPLGTVSVFLPDGDVLGAEVGDDSANIDKAKRGLAFTNREDGHAVVYAPALTTEGAYIVRTEVSGDELHRGVGRASWILGALGTLLLALSVGAADTLARRLSDPIKDLAAAADSIRDGRLDIRSPEHGPPEVVAMAGALNRLSARIEQLLISERESVADLSHRLRTPVTALRLDVESITDPELAQRIEEHVATLERTVNAVVQDARRPVKANVTSRCDVAALVGERVAFWSALADEQGRSLRTWLPSRPTWARIDTVELTDVVDVLIDNVFAHTEEGVPLEVTVNTNAAHEIVLAVQDGGPGLPGADVVARGHSNAGSSGLGLDIVRRAAIASGGRLELGRSRLGGAKVQVVLSPAETRTRERMRQRRSSAGGGLTDRLRKLTKIGSSS
ncbi:HAMP domain-containing sensor histidine kinase [Kineosporia babensis]|uniref:Signal transduction histidine-protein kinase/phosphatase MprB n=1 Tax=Kineosporia babensis TaxID=499548 RepID=A0A9X1SRL6_9ACTN|nr:HAMP domain-containing sensor histidine kinase [Kineosporia babensis]MCD5309762.1 HAMP domain-containing histidine kinase [Kineosporia babensis]